MGRGIQIVEAHVGKAKLTFMNTHAESTKDYEKERRSQLRALFGRAVDVAADRAVILGGDLNARDSDVDATLPAGGLLEDSWLSAGARKECKFTWDVQRNTNKEMVGKFKPRCRFDRLYTRDSNPDSSLRLTHFGLVGLEKVAGTQSFPSDHWGVELTLKIKSR